MKYLLLWLFLLPTYYLNAQQKLIKVNKTNNDPEETSIAINPTNPLWIAASSNIKNYYYSLDGGKTWTEKTIVSENGIWGDPMVHFDNNGNLYYAHLGKNPDKFYPNWIDKMVVQRINMSSDSCFADAPIGFNNDKIQDKEWLSNDLNGNLFLTWTEFDKYKSKSPSDHSRIRFAKSSSLGNSWSNPLIVSDLEGDCLDSDSTMEGATSCADSKGNIYVCWSGINKIWLDKSTDGGLTFGKDKIIADHVNGWNVPVRNIFRANGMPFILCNNSNSRFKNRIYVNWTDTRNGDADIFMKYSDDEGETWSNDIRVNDDPLRNGADQFSNNFCIDASTGNVYVIFYDKRNSSTGAFIDVYVAMSADGGVSWKNLRVTTNSFATPGKTVFFGDYIDIDAVQGIVMPLFTQNENDVLAIYNCVLDFNLKLELPKQPIIQSTILNDSLYIHLNMSDCKKSTLTIKYNTRKIVIKDLKPGETEYVFNARGFTDASIVLKYGTKNKTIKVSKKKQSN